MKDWVHDERYLQEAAARPYRRMGDVKWVYKGAARP